MREPALSQPNNIAAEQGLLGAILFDNRTLQRIGELQAGDFFEPWHGRIFEAIKASIGPNSVADPVSLRGRVQIPQELGGDRYLLTLLDRAARLDSHAVEYANVIRDCAARRDLIQAARELEALALSPPEGATAMDVAEEVRATLGVIASSQSGTPLRSILDAAQGVLEDADKPEPPIIKTGIAELDRLFGGGLGLGDLVIIAGRPGMGKTSLATNVASNIAASDVVDTDGCVVRPRVVLFFSLEMPEKQLAARALSRLSFGTASAFSHSSMRDKDRRPSRAQLEPLTKRLRPGLLIDDRGGITLRQMQARVNQGRQRYGGIDAIVVDYLQLMGSDVRSDNRVQEITAITMGLKALAKREDCPVIALSQLSRGVESRDDKKPLMSDLRESGSIEQDADTILFAYREHYYLKRQEPKPREGQSRSDLADREREWHMRLEATAKVFTAILAKNRHGATGEINLHCELASDLISDPLPSQRAQAPAYGSSPTHWTDRE